MTNEVELRRAFAQLADESVGRDPTSPYAARVAAGGAIRRARRRLAARIAVPVVALLAVGGVAAVSLRSPSDTDQVRTAGGGQHSAVTTQSRPLTPATAPTGGDLLAKPVVIGGWEITQVPAGDTLSSVSAGTLADFGPEGAACPGKPSAAVEVITNSGYTIEGLLQQGGNLPVAMAGTTGVELSAHNAGSTCAAEVTTLFEPRPGALIQVVTTGSGVAGAQVIAAGIKPAG